MKSKVDLYCVECGKFLGKYYGHVAQDALIEGSQYVLCPSPVTTRDDGCCAPFETKQSDRSYVRQIAN
jgi:hypothetical protein